MNILSMNTNQKKHTPVVLDMACQARIAIMNDVARDLKKRGYTLGLQKLYPVRWNSRPAIEIKRSLSVSIMPIVCQSGQTWFDEGNGYAVYRGVTLWWRNGND